MSQPFGPVGARKLLHDTQDWIKTRARYYAVDIWGNAESKMHLRNNVRIVESSAKKNHQPSAASSPKKEAHPTTSHQAFPIQSKQRARLTRTKNAVPRRTARHAAMLKHHDDDGHGEKGQIGHCSKEKVDAAMTSKEAMSGQEPRFLLTSKALSTIPADDLKLDFNKNTSLLNIHQIVCDNLRSKAKDHTVIAGKCPEFAANIPIPSFRLFVSRQQRAKRPKLAPVSGNIMEEKLLEETDYMALHKPFEQAEKRERRRELELFKYQAYMQKLAREHPELYQRKYHHHA